MNKDVVIVGAGPAGIFTALELLRRGSRASILIVEKGQAVENRRCPKQQTKNASTASPTVTSPPGFLAPARFRTASCR